MIDNPSGILYKEHYLYSQKAWEMAPSGFSYYDLHGAVLQNAPIVVTASGYETTTPEQPWAQLDGSGKYEKVGFGYFDLMPDGQYNPDTYQFSLHPDSSGKIIFNGVLRENVYIEYESSPSGYYVMDEIDYNPIRNEVEGGFIHFSQTTEPTTIFANVSQDSVRADGYQGVRLSATVYDEDFDRIPEIDVVFELQNLTALGDNRFCETGKLIPNTGTEYEIDSSGNCISTREITNRRGQAFSTYRTTEGKTGLVSVKAYVLSASGINDDASFIQFFMSAGPFTLDVSLLDTLDYLV